MKPMDFALNKHRNQKRIEGSPYIFHPVRTYYTLSKIFPNTNLTAYTILSSSLLHDTIEDTNTTKEEIEELFGKTCKDIILELTNPKGLKRAQKGPYLAKQMPKMSNEALCIKLADRLDNITDLNLLSIEKRNRYLHETQYILYKLENTDRKLTQEQNHLLSSLHSTIDSYTPAIYLFKDENKERDL